MMMRTLSRFRPLVRTVVDLDLEYRIRNAVLRLVRVERDSRWNEIIHATTWKAGSQWMRLVLSDPVVYRYSGLKTDPGGGLYPGRAGFIRTPVYATREEVVAQAMDQESTWFAVMRCLRDVLVSFYFSNAVTHDPSPGIMSRRERLSKLSVEDGLISTMEHDFEDIVRIARSWYYEGLKEEVYSFERLSMGSRPEWLRLLRRLDILMEEEVLDGIIQRYSFENLSGGRGRGDEDTTHRYRSGTSGDWVKYFTPKVTRLFEERFGDLEDFGAFS